MMGQQMLARLMSVASASSGTERRRKEGWEVRDGGGRASIKNEY
jgi:hypothetical protein